ncbi:MAG: hypothetical protein ACYC9O_18515 [Candidatus Latescibacterota bacterium]
MHGIRVSAPILSFPRDKAAASDIRTGYIHDRPARRLVITLRGPGCSWVDRGEGCFMCGHHAGTTRGAIPAAEEYLAQFRSEISGYDLSGIEILSLYNSGSVLNPDEVPPEALRAMIADIRNLGSIRKVVLETRAEYIDRSRLAELKDILGPGRILSVALGLETSDDLKRSLCINKGCSLAEISRAVEAVRGLGETQLYVLLGLPFLTESEAVEDAIRSIRCARDLGADEIHIEPLTLQRHTLLEYLHQAGLYRLPSLYSVYSVLQAVVPEIRPYVSPFLHMPLPEAIPSGCPSCTPGLIDNLLGRYNLLRNRESLEYPRCACLPLWEERRSERDPRPLDRRISDALESLASGRTT